MDAPRIDIIIVTATGSRDHVVRCLSSIEAISPATMALSVTIVDNASRDGVVELIQRCFPTTGIYQLDGNYGFAAGVNHGIGATHGDFVMLLNPDAELSLQAVERLLAVMVSDPGLGAVGPQLVDLAGSADHNAKRAFPTPLGALGHFAGRFGAPITRAGGYGRDDIADDAVAEVDAISGSCMLVRRRVIDEIGLLDPGYWMYGEDLDWCRRMGLGGWRIAYVGDAIVLHVKHGVSGARRSLRLDWSFHRAMGRFYRRFDAGQRPLLDVAVYLAILGKFVASRLQALLGR